MNVIQPFRRRIIIEALIKALLIGLIVFGVAMVRVAATYKKDSSGFSLF